MTTHTPGQSGPTSPETYLTSREVIGRFRWGRTYGYQMLASTGFPRPIGGRFRLDTLMQWEDRVLAGELTGHPDPREDSAADLQQVPQAHPVSADTGSVAAPAEDERRLAAPTRRRTRGLGRAVGPEPHSDEWDSRLHDRRPRAGCTAFANGCAPLGDLDTTSSTQGGQR